MAEGGYDPIPSGEHEGEDNEGRDSDDENTGLLYREGQKELERQEQERRRWQERHSSRRADSVGGVEIGMKHRVHYQPTTKTSTTQETSFIDTPSGKMHESVMEPEQQKEEIESRIKEKFENPDFSKFISGIDVYDRLYLELRRSNAKRYYLSGDESKFLKQLKDALGETRRQVNDRKYEMYLEEEAKEEKKKQDLEKLRKSREEILEKSEHTRDVLEKLGKDLDRNERILQGLPTTQEAEAVRSSLPTIRESMEGARIELNGYEQDLERLGQDISREEENVREGQERVETARERVNERLLSLRDRIKEIFKKHGFTVIAVATAIATVIGVIVSNLKAGLTNVAKGLGNGLKELGKKLGEILPGMIGAIASFLFRTAGEVIGFLAKNAWLLIVGLVVLAVEQFKKKSG